MKYDNKFGLIELNIEHLNEETIGVAMSGGADSTLLCYLLANTIREKGLNIKIQPFNGYDMWAPGDSNGLPEIIPYIRKRCPRVSIKWPLSTIFDTDGGKNGAKQDYIRPLVKQLEASGIIDHTYHGTSLGPPEDVQKTFGGELFRIKGGKDFSKNQRVADKNHTTPFIEIDKRFIVQEFKDQGIVDLLDMTTSCIGPETGCGNTCFWCKEREWAISEVFKA